MSEVTKEQVEAAIKGYVEPHLGRDLVSANCVKGIAIEGDQVKVNVVLGFPAKGIADTVKAAVEAQVKAVAGVSMVQADVTWKVAAH
jgi:ATP-binding protein involved in chromosome partitioning